MIGRKSVFVTVVASGLGGGPTAPSSAAADDCEHPHVSNVGCTPGEPVG